MPSYTGTSSKKDIASFLIPSTSIGVVSTNAALSSTNNKSRSLMTTNNNNSLQKQLKKTTQITKNDPQVVNLVEQNNSNSNNNTQSSTIVALPRYGNLAVSTGTNVKSVIRKDADQFPRGYAQPHNAPIDVGGFRCTSRGGARLVALPEMEKQQPQQTFKSNTNNSSSVLNNAQVMNNNNTTIENNMTSTSTPNVSFITQPSAEVKLRDVWKFGLRTKAPLLTEIDPSEIGRATEKKKSGENQQQNNNTSSDEKVVKFVRIQPEYLHRGMVQPPQAQVVEVDTKVLEDDAARLMNPRQRRELMEAQRKAREGLVALREVQAAKTKLSRTCQKLYPHGCLGVVDGPYSQDPDATAYGGLSQDLKSEASKVSRKGKKDAGGFSRPHNTADMVLNRDVNSTNFFTGELDETKTIGQKKIEKNYCGVDPTRTGGLRTSVECRPKDQLRSFAVGV